MVEIVNIVAGGDLHRELNLAAVFEEVRDAENVHAELKKASPWQLILRFEEQKGVVVVYRTGKYIIRGGKSHQKYEMIRDGFFELFSDYGVIDSANNISCRIQNIVYLENLGTDIDLNKAILRLGMNRTEYEPEQFPAVVYRPEEVNVVLLVFSSGEVIITGSTSEEEAKETSSLLQDRLQIASASQ